MSNDNEKRLADLERRIRRIELHVGLSPIPSAETPIARTKAPTQPLATPLRPVPTPRLQSTGLEPKPAVELLSQLAPPPETPRQLTPPPLPVPAPGAAQTSSRPVLSYPTAPKPKALRQNPLEQVIGIKWAGWIGAIVLVIGAALGIKYAYDQGLFPTISPAARLILMSLAGFALIGIGEWVYRKIGTLSATGFFGAGVATLFIISYAGYGYYQVYTRNTAFVMMGLCTLIGAAVAMRAGLVSVAVLSLIGGNIAPIVLHGDVTNLFPFLLYLLMLQTVALVLAFWGAGEKWWTLRGLALASTSLWIGSLLGPRASGFEWSWVMWFSLLYAALFHFELLISSLSRRHRRPAETAGVVFALITTALISAAMVRIFWIGDPWLRGTWLLTFAAITTVISILIGHALPKLSISYRVQAAALVIISVPIVFTGATISFGWAVLALALAALGGLLDDRTARIASVASWFLALVNLLIWSTSTQPAAAQQLAFTVWHQGIPIWALYAAIIGLSGHPLAFLAGLERRATKSDSTDLARLTSLISFLASAVFAATAIAVLPPFGATAVLLVYAWLCTALDRTSSRLAFDVQGWALVLLATAKWAAIDTFAARFSPDWAATQYQPLLNPLMLTAVALAASLIGMFWLKRDSLDRLIRRTSDRALNPAIVSLIIAVAILTFGLSFEVDRIVERLAHAAWPLFQLKLMEWTVLWSAAAIILFAGVRWIDPAALARSAWRRFAWIIAILLTFKFLILDTTCWLFNGSVHPASLVNAQMFTAAAVVAMLIVLQWLLRRDESNIGDSLGRRIALAATLVILWAGTLEIGRAINAGIFPGSSLWPHYALTQLAWTSWWMIGLVAYLAYATWMDPREVAASRLLQVVALIPILLGIKFLTLDTVLAHGLRPVPATILFNAQAATGAIILASLILLRRMLPDRGRLRFIAAAVAVLVPLWCGTLEIDRAFDYSPALAALFADRALAKLVALSIFFSIYASAAVALGFVIRSAGLRYFGLALFALTLAKVGLVDLSHASTGYRFLSFIGLGALLLVTSVLYGRLSPRLLRTSDAVEESATRTA